ncbi:anaerobic ribonucleoside-triphosphate reductase activating protein [Myxococcota bacterium]|nr:anaerobic ribonucleoside-triphosphate reductase activating protein [Myxococcota bacterium]MBU1381808.1 anaerobic ribonucleoside-triphosphate reductase activating protein [Myxococcota bacterium]MBU1498585.1 anaerobic ribonucleoside-triphosphate reductase activating protein [Myxococcota bacterium]
MFVHILGTTLVDYPGKVASTVFSAHCNLRCPFCHNSDLVLETSISQLQELSVDYIKAFFTKRLGFLTGVVFTGGEPLLNPDLPSMMITLKEMGLSIKLDTNGTNPEILKDLIDIPDYIAMDVKSSPEKYNLATGGRGSFSRILESLEILRENNKRFELRTTAVRPLFDINDVKSLFQYLGKVEIWALQSFYPDHVLNEAWSEIPPYTPDEMKILAFEMKNTAKVVPLRF